MLSLWISLKFCHLVTSKICCKVCSVQNLRKVFEADMRQITVENSVYMTFHLLNRKQIKTKIKIEIFLTLSGRKRDSK